MGVELARYCVVNQAYWLVLCRLNIDHQLFR